MITGKLISYVSIVVLLILSVVHIAVYYPALQNPIGSHFDAQGNIDGWMSKSQLALFYILTQIGLPLLMLGIGRLVYVLPDSMINVPRKEYWLAPERRAETLGIMETMLAWISVSTMSLLIAMFQITFMVNLGQIKPTTVVLLTPTIVYSVFVIFLVVWLCLRFNRVPKVSDPNSAD